MEKTARYVVGVAAQRVYFPCLRFAHSPQLDLSIVGSTGQQGERGVECRPINTAVVALEDIFDNWRRKSLSNYDSTEFKMMARSKPTYVVRAEKFRLDVQGGSSSSGRPCVSAGPIFLHAREIHAPASTELFLSEPGRVPNADSLSVGMHRSQSVLP